MRKEVGAGFPISVRISADEMVPGGLEPGDSVDLAVWLEEQGVDAVHVSAGNYASYFRGRMIPPMAVEEAPLVKYASLIKQAVKIPVIAVGKLPTPALAESVLAHGQADFIALGRELLADPDWPNKARQGLDGHIHRCIACNQGCISRLFDQRDVWCTVNPECGREREFRSVTQLRAKRKFLVAGGGPAGMMAARYAARAGFQVILCEAGDSLGGQLPAAAAAPHRPGWAELLQDLKHEMARLGVEVRLGTRVDKKLVQKEQPYAVVVATGAEPVRPNIPGIRDIRVVTARDLLEGRAKAFGSVLVVGGGCAGAQTAEFAAEQGHTVTLVEAEGDIAADAPLDDRTLLLGRLKAAGVRIMTHTRLLSIELDAVNLQTGGDVFGLSVETVVLCLGSRSVGHLEADLKGMVPHLFVVGDAVRPRKVTEATLEGALAAVGTADDADRERPAAGGHG